MPKNTRVSRCVNYISPKYGPSGAIAICQKSTKQNYKTGKKFKGGRGRRTRKSKNKKGGKWTRKYKKSINCKKPKGFSQRQHCKYGRKK